MQATESRCAPLVDMQRPQIEAMLAPALAGAAVREVARVGGGLVCTVYRVTTDSPGGDLALRIVPRSCNSPRQQTELLARVSASIPVPRVVWTDDGGERFGHRYLVYRWIDGMTVNEYRRHAPADRWLALAGPLGRTIGRMHASADGMATAEAACAGRRVPDAIAHALACLESREVAFGRDAAGRLARLLTAQRARLCEADRGFGLMHGDLGGRNLLVGAGKRDAGRIRGVLDWDTAGPGASLWDLGSLFRYGRRFDAGFRDRFARAYRQAGGALPRDWWPAARLLDATRLVGILHEATVPAAVRAECRVLVADLLAEWGA